MSGTSVIAFGVTAVVIAVAGSSSRPWFGEEPEPPPFTLRSKGVSITAVKREIEVGGKMEPHLFLITTGEGRGSVSVHFEMNRSLQVYRMSYPEPLMEQTITFDQDGGSRRTDLGPLPENPYDYPGSEGVSRQLVGTTDPKDGRSYVTLWTESPQIDELIKKSGFEVNYRSERQ